jgi:hypothetical protein
MLKKILIVVCSILFIILCGVIYYIFKADRNLDKIRTTIIHKDFPNTATKSKDLVEVQCNNTFKLFLPKSFSKIKKLDGNACVFYKDLASHESLNIMVIASDGIINVDSFYQFGLFREKYKILLPNDFDVLNEKLSKESHNFLKLKMINDYLNSKSRLQVLFNPGLIFIKALNRGLFWGRQMYYYEMNNNFILIKDNYRAYFFDKNNFEYVLETEGLSELQRNEFYSSVLSNGIASFKKN